VAPAAKSLILLTHSAGIGLAAPSSVTVVRRCLRALGFQRWDRRTCWRELDFWVALATLLLPFGFVFQLLRWEPVRARLFPSAGAPCASADTAA
jgi:hypothetical protein